MPAATGHDLIFGHASEARVAASVTLIGMLAVLIGGAFTAMGAPRKLDAPIARQAAGGTPPAKIRIVGAAPREDVPCGQQVWPNIAQRCLVRADARPDGARNAKTSAAKTSAGAGSPAAQDNAKLSPLTATGNAMNRWPAAQAAVTGGAPDRQTAARTAPQRNARNLDAPSQARAGRVGDDDLDELPPERMAEQAPRYRRYRGFTFHLHFGAIHF
jgi:hypothetical protein